MKHKLILTTLCLVSLIGTQVFAQGTKETPPQGGPAKPFLLPKAETFTLKNGMQVTLVPYGSIPKVAVSAKLRSGNINETENQVWLADLTGDMLKEGTTTRSGSQIASEAASMGGQVNVGVGEDTTSIGGDVLSQFGPQFVALLADVIEHPAFPESELARLKASDLRQLTVARSQSGSLAAEAFRKTLYPNHPYGRLFPTEAMLSSYGINDVRKFYSDNYGASRVHLYVAGQYDAAAMKKAITDAFGEWQKGAPPVTNIPTPVSARSIQLIDRPKAPQATVYIGLPVIAPGDPDYIGLQVTNALLGGSFASRITSNIREQKGYTYSPSSTVSTRYKNAYWAEVADVTTAVTGASIKEILYEISRLRDEPPTDAELQGIKNYLAGVFVLQNSSRQGVINQLWFADFNGLPSDYLSTYVQKLMAITPADVQRISKTYLQPDKMAVVVVGDKASVEPQLTQFGKISE